MSTKRMTMSGIYGAALMLGLLAYSAVSVEASELSGPGDEVTTPIVVVNDYIALVQVYAVDSKGDLHRLGRVGRGEIKLFEAPAELSQRGNFRVRVFPIDSPDPWSPTRGVAIKTTALNLEDGETVIVWLTRDLRHSLVEVRTAE